MKERPILFSGPMVRALLAGSKTQTRRAMKPQPTGFVGGPGVSLSNGAEAPLTPLDETAGPVGREILCPYGQPGDRLWVRETWMPYPPINDEWSSTEFYGTRHGKLSLIPECYRKPWHTLFRVSYEGHELVGWRPSIHMPRWASRITLEITSVRVERLQDISEADARAEGAPPSHPSINRISREYGYQDFPRSWYAQLWDQINGPGIWDANPWVWAITFKRLP